VGDATLLLGDSSPSSFRVAPPRRRVRPPVEAIRGQWLWLEVTGGTRCIPGVTREAEGAVIHKLTVDVKVLVNAFPYSVLGFESDGFGLAVPPDVESQLLY
jgi:hypothetical protein